MFFLIRCVFWLSVVFSTIFSAQSAAPQRGQAQTAERAAPPIGDLTRSWFGTALSFVEREALEHCVKTDCLRPSNRTDGRVASSAPQRMAQANVPLPPRRPAFAAPKSHRSTLENSSRAEYVMEHSRRS
ncbi:MAG: hypothetical protein WBF10_02880 [Methylovirgula sp.]|jgi:hypothetical protein